MKVRVQDNSIRIRLSIKELDLLARGVKLDMATCIGSETFLHRLAPVDSHEQLSLHPAQLLFEVKQSRFQALNENQEEGFELSLGETRLLIQKDFRCIGRDESHNQGLFPNPKEADNAC